MINIFEPTLDLNLVRLARRKGNPLPATLGTMVDQYEALQNELELAVSQLVTQSAIERQKAEILASQITVELKTAQSQILSFLNTYQKQMFDQIYSQIKVSEESLKFKGTDIYDMSFVSNMNYDNIKVFNDKTLLQRRQDKREYFRQEMIRFKKETSFAEGLYLMTDEKESDEVKNIKLELGNQKNDMLKEYYLAAIGFYQEAAIMGMLHNPTNNLENLKEFIGYNEANIPNMIDRVNGNRLAMGEDAFFNEMSRIAHIERMVVIAKARLKYLMLAYEGKWSPPTFKTIQDYADKNDVTFSKAVYELNQKSRQTLCVPDWILAIAEMYNQIAVFDQGPAIVPLNPYDERWIRKAKEVVTLESEGVKYAADKLFKAIDSYWHVLTFGFSSSEDSYIEAALDKALREDSTAILMGRSADFNLYSFDEDLTEASLQGIPKRTLTQEEYIAMLEMNPDAIFGMSGIFDFVAKPFEAVAKVFKNVAGVLVDVARIITEPIAKAVKAALDNTLGRVLPKSIYEKIANLTDVGLAIFQLQINKETLKKAVKAVCDVALVGVRISKEIVGYAMKQSSFVRKIDKYSGGLLTSYQNLSSAAITLSKGGKIDWKMLAIDALKLGMAVYMGATASNYFLTQQGANIVGGATGLDKTSLGRAVLLGSALILTGQASLTDVAKEGSKEAGIKAVVNNTALGDSSLGRTIATVGVNGSIDSINSNQAFSEVMRAEGEKQLKEYARSRADKELMEATNGKISLKLVEKGYDALNSDKTLSMFLDEAKMKFEREKERIAAQIANISQEELERKAAKEADKFLKEKLEDLYDLPNRYFPQKLLDYLYEKYGPRYSYDDVMTPDDFLQYQIHTPSPQRIFNVNYKKSNTGLIVGGLIAAGAAVAFFNLED